jgi:hydroxymethylpyrimidine/phosphomethylpyrimidine kinase
LADLITPNLPESAALIGSDIPNDEEAMVNMVSALRALNVNAVLLKGGHLTHCENSNDLLIFQDRVETLMAKRINTLNTHGTGCTLSSAIASYLAQGHDLLNAVTLGKHYISRALAHADELDVGSGHGPVNHFFAGHADV